MEKKASFTLAFFLCLLIVFTEVGHGSAETKLFVFGDSYADTGNTPFDDGFECWREPYGITFPGEPSGRFSDGRVLTDFIAEYLGIKSPIPYIGWKLGLNLQKYGMNFAYGGTGVFNTINGGPNMTTQINDFQQLIEQHVFTKHDLVSSVAHVSVAGNDYGPFATDGKKDVQSVINQLVLNLRRIYSLGIQRISVITVPPLGCLPLNVVLQPSSPNKICDEFENLSPRLHNILLKEVVEQLNNETGGSTFVILDLYSAFMSAWNAQDNLPENSSFVNPLEGCCKGTTSGSSCGDVDEDGQKEYVVCGDSKLSFFWDSAHPSQQGWYVTFSTLKSSLNTLILPHASSSSTSIVI